MGMPKAMKRREGELAEQSDNPGFNILAHISLLINDDGLTLSDTAAVIGVPRPTLVGWLKDCGYEYTVTRRLNRIAPVLVET